MLVALLVSKNHLLTYLHVKGASLWGDLDLKSNRPKISPRGMQNEKIENPQTLPGYRSG